MGILPANISNKAVIAAIRHKVLANQYELSQHAVNQSIIRKISIAQLKEAILQGEIIEDYPDDK